MNDNSQTEAFPANLDVANLTDAFSQDQLDKLKRLGITNLNQMLQIPFGELMAVGLNLIEIDDLQQQVDIVIKKKKMEIKHSDKLSSTKVTQASFTNSDFFDKGFIKLDCTQNLKDYQLNFDSNDSFNDEVEPRLVIDDKIKTPKHSIFDLPPDIPLTSIYDITPPKKNKTTTDLSSSSITTSTAPSATIATCSQGLKKSGSGSKVSNKRTHPSASDRRAAKKKAAEPVSTTEDINMSEKSENKTASSAELDHMNFRQLLLEDIPPDIWDIFYRDIGTTATSIASSATYGFSAQRNLSAQELNKPVYGSTRVSKASHPYRVGCSAAAGKPIAQRSVTTTRRSENKTNSSLDPAYINFRKLLLGAKLPSAQVRASFYHEISDDAKDENAKSGGEGILHTTATTVPETPQKESENKSLAARPAEYNNTQDPPKLKCGNSKSSLKSVLTTPSVRNDMSTSMPPPTSVTNATSTAKPPPKSESNVMSSSKPKSERKAKSTSIGPPPTSVTNATSTAKPPPKSESNATSTLMGPPPSVRNAPSTSMSPPTSVPNATSTAKPPPKSESNAMSSSKPKSKRKAKSTSMGPPPSLHNAPSTSKPPPASVRKVTYTSEPPPKSESNDMSTSKPLSERSAASTSMGPPPSIRIALSTSMFPPTSVPNATSSAKPSPKSESNVMSSSKPKSKRKAKSTSMGPPPSVHNAPSTSMSPPTSVPNTTSTAKPPPKSVSNAMSTSKPLSERNAMSTSMGPSPSMRNAPSTSKPPPKSERSAMSTAKPLSERNATSISMGPPPALLLKAPSRKVQPRRRMSTTKELFSSTGVRSDLQYDPRRAANPTTGVGVNSLKNCAGQAKFSEIRNLLIASDWYSNLGCKNKLPINCELLTVRDELIKFHQFKQSRKFDAGFIKSNDTLNQIFGKLHINIDENGQVVQLPGDGPAVCSGSSDVGGKQHLKLPDMSQPPPNLRVPMVLGPFNKPPSERNRRFTVCK